MASTSETGHAKNVANFQALTAFATGYGTTYNPSKTILKLPALNTLITTSQANIADVVTKNTAYNNATNQRSDAFENLQALSTRLINALQATDATPEKIKDAKVFNRKLHGKRATPPSITDPNAPAPATISSSQQSYDQQIQHFTGLISVLQSETTFTPNEADLKITALNTKLADLIAKNNAVFSAHTTISNSRLARNKTLYKADTGLVDIAGEVKKYIKSVSGATSPEFAQVKGIEFKAILK